jgi:regulator of sigma E protease
MNKGYRPIDITVIRNGERVKIEDVTFGNFEDSGVSFGEVDFRFFSEEKNFINIVKHSFFRSVSTVKMTVDSIVSLLTGRYGIDAVSGPVGVAGTVGDAVKLGLVNIAYLVALLSANLGVFNLVPFPALDGGRLFILLVELIRGKPMKKETEAYINFVGLAVLLLFMAFVMW